MSRWRQMSAAVVAILVAGCGGHASDAPAGVPVKVMVVGASGGVDGIRYSATVTPRAQVDLAFKVNGFVVEIHQVQGADARARDLQQGDAVRKGQVLAKVRPDEYQDQLTKAKANLAKAQASLDKSSADFRRATNLQATNSITGSDFDSAKQEYETSVAAVDGAKAQVNEAELNLGYTSLKAPMDGVLLQRNIEVGTLVGPGTVAFTLADLSSVKVVFGVPDVMLSSVALGRQIGITTASAPDRVFTGTVTAVAPSANSLTRVSTVEVSVTNADGALRDGMVASLVVPPNVAKSAATAPVLVSVPLDAVVRATPGDTGYAVMRVVADSGRDIARLTPVTLGEVTGNAILVRTGLAAGDRVIVNGATIVQDGDVVRPVD
jgi:RND family efflux transporter MFP subunit